MIKYADTVGSRWEHTCNSFNETVYSFNASWEKLLGIVFWFAEKEKEKVFLPLWIGEEKSRWRHASER